MMLAVIVPLTRGVIDGEAELINFLRIPREKERATDDEAEGGRDANSRFKKDSTEYVILFYYNSKLKKKKKTEMEICGSSKVSLSRRPGFTIFLR